MKHTARSDDSILRGITARRLIIIASLLGIGLVSLCIIYASVKNNTGLAAFDTPVLEWFAAHRTPLLTTAMHLVTELAGPVASAIIVVTIAAFMAWRKKSYWKSGLLVASLAGSFVISTGIKMVIERARPPLDTMSLPLETGFSFPSNHTLGAAMLALLIGYFLYSRRPHWRYMALWAGISILGVGLMATTRLYLGYHWLTDVSASACLALVIIAFVILIDTYRSLRQRSTKAL